MQESRIHKSSRNIAWGTVRELVLLVFGFLARTVFIHQLGAEYTGVSGLYSNILTVLSLAEFGVGNVLLYSLYQPIHDGDREKTKALLRFYRKIYIGIALGVAIIGVSLIPFLGYIVNSDLPRKKLVLYYVLYLANSVASYVLAYKATMIQADQKIYIKNISQTVLMVVQYSLQMVVLLIWKNFALYLSVQVLCTLGQNIALSLVANQMYPYLKEPVKKLDAIDKSKVVTDTKAMFLYKLSTVLINNTANILISVMLGTVVVGYYSNYFALITYVTLFTNVIITGVNASLGNLNAEQNPQNSYLAFRRLIFLFNMMAGFCTCCYLGIVQDFIPLWIGEEYLLPFPTVLAILTPFYVTTVISPVWMYRETMGLFKEIRYMKFTAALLNILLGILLGRWLGLAGIVLSMALCRILTIVWYEPIILYRRFRQPVSGYFKMQGEYSLVNIFILVLSQLAVGCLPGGMSSLVAIPVKVVLIAGIWLGMTALFHGRKSEMQWTKQVIGQRLSVLSKKK